MVAGLPGDCVHRYSTATDAAAEVPGLLAAGDLVLLKASRAVRLETVADAIAVPGAGRACDGRNDPTGVGEPPRTGRL